MIAINSDRRWLPGYLIFGMMHLLDRSQSFIANTKWANTNALDNLAICDRLYSLTRDRAL